MADLLIREYRAGDIPALKAIWAECFGDPEKLVDSFFEILPSMGFCLCAEVEGEVAGAAYIIEGMSLEKDRNIPCAYLYAVGVSGEYRHHGIGSGVSKACVKLAKERGAEIICTQPAEKSLYKWYSGIIGTKFRLCRKRTELESEAGKAEKISAGEYFDLREDYLQGREHMKASAAVIEFENELCLAYDGGMFKTEEGIAFAYIENGCCHVKELLSRGDSRREAAAVGAALGAEKTVLYEPAEEAESYIAYDCEKMTKGCVWNISFD